MLSRIIISMAMVAALFTVQVDLAARSCILSSTASQKVCQSNCCVNKTCCATSAKNTAPQSQPLAKADSSYKLNATSVALPTAVSPSREFGAERFLLSNAASGAHSPLTPAVCPFAGMPGLQPRKNSGSTAVLDQ